MAQKWTALDAAQRYASEAKFAEEFNKALSDIYEEQLRRLERIAAWSAVRAGELPVARSPFPAQVAPAERGSGAVQPEQVARVLEQYGPAKGARGAAAGGMTRGQIAKVLGIDSRDPGLTRALRALRERGRLHQRGERRAARYALKSA